MGNSNVRQPDPDDKREALEELRAIRRELKIFRELVDDFMRVYLGARFPFGKASDRWGRR